MINNQWLAVELEGTEECLWAYTLKTSGRKFCVAPPIFEVDGVASPAHLKELMEIGKPGELGNGVVEHRCEGAFAAYPDLLLQIVFQIKADSPVVRFHYVLAGTSERRLTKGAGKDALTYLSLSLAEMPQATEVRVAEFNEMVHSYCLSEWEVRQSDFDNELSVMGPILAASDETHSLLLAYEHGSQIPDAFLQYGLGQNRGVSLKAIKGNYFDGQQMPYQTLWLQMAVVEGNSDALAAAYRGWVLDGMSRNAESRKPYVFYNTWNFQERNRWWNGQPYLASMTQERTLAEIDVAHRMGIDVFVLDTGWYQKTGDWQVNLDRFPDGLKSVKAKLDGYGMKLGLWFNPVIAAVSSRMLQENRECLMSWNGKIGDPHEVWETEESQGMCLVSRYKDAFAEELIRLVREVGVTYFKWDAIGQYGCNDPGHDHGTAQNSERERADCYAFEQVRAMSAVVDKLCAACPEAIVDFDVTEGGRTVGLGFLSAGKYFLINNGPYSHNYNMAVPADGNINLFFFPGPARAWICRTPLSYDKWIPSVLFLTHYLPDDPVSNQDIALASLALGQNGLWGDLLAISDKGIARFGETLARYKQVRDDITQASPVFTGTVGGSPEVREKIAPSGRGVVCVFASAAGQYAHVTQNIVAEGIWHNEGVSVRRDSAGRAVLTCDFAEAGAKLIFFQ